MKTEKLTCERARKIPIEKVLEFLGHFPTRNLEKEAWYLSPLRSENQASFKVSKKLNRWYDHGLGIGGNSIDLICALSKVSVSQALEILTKLKTVNFNEPLKPQTSFKESKIEIKKVKITYRSGRHV
ncbi:MAG: CHC2 zinc finger domain-containing protein [Leeuwenhoekiella sp.]